MPALIPAVGVRSPEATNRQRTALIAAKRGSCQLSHGGSSPGTQVAARVTRPGGRGAKLAGAAPFGSRRSSVMRTRPPRTWLPPDGSALLLGRAGLGDPAMLLRHQSGRHHRGDRRLQLVLPAAHYLVVAAHHRLEACPRDIGRVVLVRLAYLGVGH